jgi:bacterioferritin (cytochrome b1)
MKAFKNRLEEMAEATVNALDYSDSKVEYPDISIVQKWPKEIILPLYDLYKNTRYSELTSILMYTQHQARFEEIGELMLGIGLVEMVHYDKLGDFLLKASDVMDTDIPGNNQLTVHPIIIDLGTSAESALRLSLQAEKETLEEYYKVFDSLNKKEEYIKRSDYIPVTYLIQKFIADEEYHISLLKKALKEYEDSGDEPKKCKSVTVII